MKHSTPTARKRSRATISSSSESEPDLPYHFSSISKSSSQNNINSLDISKNVVCKLSFVSLELHIQYRPSILYYRWFSSGILYGKCLQKSCVNIIFILILIFSFHPLKNKLQTRGKCICKGKAYIIIHCVAQLNLQS